MLNDYLPPLNSRSNPDTLTNTPSSARGFSATAGRMISSLVKPAVTSPA